MTADQYQQTERAMKYSFLIVILILSAIFLVESITKSKINIVQYIVTGLSLCLFYLLLLSISEYISFGWAYLIAGVFTLATGILYLYASSDGKRCASLRITRTIRNTLCDNVLHKKSGSIRVKRNDRVVLIQQN